MLVLASLTDPIVEVAVDVVEKLGTRGRLRADGAGERVYSGAERGHHAVRRLQRLGRRVLPVRGRCRRLDRQPRRLVDRVRGRLLRARRPDREARPQALHQEAPPRLGRPLVRAPRRRDGLLHAHAPDRPHVHLAPGGRRRRCRSGASPFFTLAGCVPWVFMLTFIGKKAGENWEKWKDSLHYVDYAVAAMIVVGVIWLFVRNRRSKRERPGGGEAATEASLNLSPGCRARGAPGPGRAAARVELGPPRARARAARLVVLRARRRAAQVLRGGAARRHRRRAPDRAAPRGRPRCCASWTAGASCDTR